MGHGLSCSYMFLDEEINYALAVVVVVMTVKPG